MKFMNTTRHPLSMSKKLILFLSCAFLAGGCAHTPPAHPLPKSDTVIWAGLDYSLARMYGTTDFKDPDAIFPHYLDSWNALFLQERIKVTSSLLNKRVVPDTEHMAERNKIATKDHVIRQDGDFVGTSDITSQDIADAVRSYKLSESSGLGLVFIVDRLVKSQSRGAVYLVFFDVSTREVVASQRVVAKAAGVGFRNYWFGVIKNAEPELREFR
ncbi:MAG: hypothetical protein ABSA47_00920 [Verrucomicrobiota bacterium]